MTLLKNDLYSKENKVYINHISGFGFPREPLPHISGKKTTSKSTDHISGSNSFVKLK